jgi:hypothetical protein
MKTKEDIVNNWLPRYTGKKLEEFGRIYSYLPILVALY